MLLKKCTSLSKTPSTVFTCHLQSVIECSARNVEIWRKIDGPIFADIFGVYGTFWFLPNQWMTNVERNSFIHRSWKGTRHWIAGFARSVTRSSFSRLAGPEIETLRENMYSFPVRYSLRSNLGWLFAEVLPIHDRLSILEFVAVYRIMHG